MPCNSPEPTRDELYEDFINNLPKEIKRLKKECDYLTDLLCMAGRAYTNKTAIPNDVLKWWEDHKKWDDARGSKW